MAFSVRLTARAQSKLTAPAGSATKSEAATKAGETLMAQAWAAG